MAFGTSWFRDQACTACAEPVVIQFCYDVAPVQCHLLGDGHGLVEVGARR